MQNITEVIFTLLPFGLFLYLSLTLLGVVKYTKQTAFLAQASAITKIAVYGGTISFLIMAIIDLAKL